MSNLGGAPAIEGFQQLIELGRGSRSIVWAGVHEASGERVALKVIEVVGSGASLIAQDANAAAPRDLAGVVPLWATASTSDGRPVLVRPLMPSSLAETIRRGGLSATTVAGWARELATTLDAAHRRGITHGAVTPENVLISATGEAFLVDFSLESLEAAKAALPPVVPASFAHRPPEGFAASGTAGPAGDVYSLASTIFTALVGAPPFGTIVDGGMDALAGRVNHSAPPSAERFVAGVDPVLNSGLAKHPTQRYRTCTEFAGALTAAISAGSMVPPPTAPLMPPLIPPVGGMADLPTLQAGFGVGPPPTVLPQSPAGGSRRLVAVAVAALLIALAVGVTAFVVTRDDSTVATGRSSRAETTQPSKTTTTIEEDEPTTATTQPDTVDPVRNGLGGMRGTTPLVNLTAEFRSRLLSFDPSLVDLNYSAESYDATIVLALAAIEANDDGSELASHVNGITRGGQACKDFAGCRTALDAGADIDYDGQSGRLEFSGNGEPTSASYGILQFGDERNSSTGDPCIESTRCIDEAKTTYVTGSVPASADVAPVPVQANRPGNGVLNIGTLLPVTGSLAFLYPPMIAGTRMAIAEINQGGGFRGADVQLTEADSGDASTHIAPASVTSLLSADVDGIVGAASSSVTLSVLDTIVTAGIPMFSPANTSRKLSSYDDRGLYFRAAPSDIMQGVVLGDTIVADGRHQVYALVLNDDYSVGLFDDMKDSIDAGSKAEIVGSSIYDPQAVDYLSEAAAAAQSGADAIVIIGFDETSKIVRDLIGAGLAANHFYGVDGNMGNALANSFDQGR